jgi:hypothetical protein
VKQLNGGEPDVYALWSAVQRQADQFSERRKPYLLY